MLSNSDQDMEDPVGPSEAHLARKSTVGRLLKLIGCALLVMLVVIVSTMWYLMRMATAEVPEYEAAIEATADQVQVEKDRQSFESQITTVANEAAQPNDWQVAITQQEINAWLARLESDEIPEMKEAGLIDPRVLIDADSITFAIRGNVGSTQGVVTTTIKPTVTEGGELALTVLEAKVGKLTLPMAQVLQLVEQTKLKKHLPIRSKQDQDSWTLIINLVQLFDAEEMIPQLTAINLREGEMLIQGKTEEANVTPSKN